MIQEFDAIKLILKKKKKDENPIRFLVWQGLKLKKSQKKNLSDVI